MGGGSGGIPEDRARGDSVAFDPSHVLLVAIPFPLSSPLCSLLCRLLLIARADRAPTDNDSSHFDERELQHHSSRYPIC